VYLSAATVRSNFPAIVSLLAGSSVPKRILIADDHELILRGVRALLRANPGWEVCGEALDGREAVTKAIELRPDLVVLDYAMPCLDGLSAAKEIHQLLPTVPIVLHTLYGTTEVELAANRYGIRRVVGKAKGGALISAVEELLNTEAASQPDAISDETSEIPTDWGKR
jgi:DNA-binding NarL/FixJ family response regulator